MKRQNFINYKMMETTISKSQWIIWDLSYYCQYLYYCCYHYYHQVSFEIRNVEINNLLSDSQFAVTLLPSTFLTSFYHLIYELMDWINLFQIDIILRLKMFFSIWSHKMQYDDTELIRLPPLHYCSAQFWGSLIDWRLDLERERERERLRPAIIIKWTNYFL